MTEISQRGKLFYGYYNFNIYFFIIFGTNVVPKFEVSKLAVISHSGTLVHAYHDFNVSFFKIHIIWANVVPNSNALQVH